MSKPCVCGHSPTGQCLGWHDLSYEGLVSVEQEWLADNPDSDWLPIRQRPQPEEPSLTDTINQ